MALPIPSTKPKQRAWLDAIIERLTADLDWLREYDPASLQLTELEDVLADLRVLRAELHNRSPVMRGRRTSVTITPIVRQQIRVLHQQYPTMNQHELAWHVNTNCGRICETLTGKRL